MGSRVLAFGFFIAAFAEMQEKDLWPARTDRPERAERNATVGYCAQTVRFELPLL